MLEYVLGCGAVRTMDEESYGPAEVSVAAGVPRPTLHSWIARKYLPLSPGPGMGRERRFTLDEVVMVAITAELSRLGLSVGAAAHAADLRSRLIADGHEPPIHEPGWTLVITPAAAPAGVDSSTMRPLGLIKVKNLTALRKRLKGEYGNPASVVLVDISAIAKRTLERLKAGESKKERQDQG